MSIEVPTDETRLFWWMFVPLLVMLVVEEVGRTMLGRVDIRNGKLASPSQVDNDLLKLHRVGGYTGWYGVLNALTDVDNKTTAPVLYCAAAISVPTHRFEARDL